MLPKKCPDCGGNLEEGACIDHTYGYTMIERYAKTTIPVDRKIGLMAEGDFHDVRRVITLRCEKCNRLFSYAQDLILGQTTRKQLTRTFWIIIIGMFAFIGLVFILVAVYS